MNAGPETLRPVLTVLAVVLAAYLALCAWAFASQRAQIYYPVPEANHPGGEPWWLDSQGERLKVWTLRREGPRTLLYFGGNAEDVGGSLESFAAAFPRHSLYLVNYRGYGGSSGRPSETALVADALTVFDHLRSRHASVTVVGRSLGAGVAVQLASRRPVERLVLVTPFDSLVNLAGEYFRWLPVGLLLRDRYESARHAPEVAAPVLIVIAGDDEIVPMRRSRALAGAFPPSRVQTVVVPGVGHNTLDLSPAYLASVGRFIGDQRAAAPIPSSAATASAMASDAVRPGDSMP